MKIAFICLGNICRSPMAEFVMKDMTNKHIINSFATSAYHIGEDMHKGTKELLIKNNIKCDNFICRQISLEDVKYHDIIFALDDEILNTLQNRFQEHKNKIQSFCTYCNLGYKNVPDPWYSGNFEEVYMIIKHSCKNILKAIDEENINCN
ncbi:low molecular weight phosphotyrosine protein phosphatase [Campylobacter canadensis]|uniref:low molecular weight protein-tyrosine-phosphatase n=1 Tax=Campylobacter canadensis TaxID=449520 RepID=UPI0015540B1B|nr:low molecular weight protein-tyrosine-phosphatase [Campylobacter canadensis]MBZ7994252.1 low molecular weight phosphotyrosine protein phosphatase [Campylobacter canadensis]MBZ7995756.1 low molecular weight phosphotyrosine protein phosphatase [Campylobacter canadensis]MBZ7999584.1 low molecular weight phosphotyrosine protein phosphatase [Campylobacter canadensis]MBZ8001329.1 low molecular weight phosphotyrosine protein phosphatase [Campylobacter canadensis]MBZ8004274.1 low molecular weight p